MKNEACLLVLPGTFIACGEMGYCSDECLVIGSFDRGAAVAFGLMGMAEAIRAKKPYEAMQRAEVAYLLANDWFHNQEIGDYWENEDFDRYDVRQGHAVNIQKQFDRRR